MLSWNFRWDYTPSNQGIYYLSLRGDTTSYHVPILRHCKPRTQWDNRSYVRIMRKSKKPSISEIYDAPVEVVIAYGRVVLSIVSMIAVAVGGSEPSEYANP